MSTQYIIKMQIGSECMDCATMQAGDEGLGLNQNGMTWMEKAPVCIEVAHDELNVSVKSYCAEDVCIVRNGRMRQLKLGQSIRLLSKDELHVGALCARIIGVYRQQSTTMNARWQAFKTASRAMMLTMAAALVFSACSPSSPKTIESQRSGDMVRVTPYEQCSRDTQDAEAIKTCCKAMNDEKDKQFCCDELKTNNPGVSCDGADHDNKAEQEPLQVGENIRDVREEVMGDVALSPYGECLERVGDDAAKLLDCCKNMSEEFMQKMCCDELAKAHPGTSCDAPEEEKAPEVRPVLAGAIARTPYGMCEDTVGKDADKIKACCMAKEGEVERNLCCDELSKAHPGMSCDEKGADIQESVVGRMIAPEKAQD